MCVKYRDINYMVYIKIIKLYIFIVRNYNMILLFILYFFNIKFLYIFFIHLYCVLYFLNNLFYIS